MGGGVSLLKRAGLGRAGLGRPLPSRGRDPRRSEGAEPLERTRHWRGDMAGTSLGARFYRQIKRHPGVSSVPRATDSHSSLAAPRLPVPASWLVLPLLLIFLQDALSLALRYVPCSLNPPEAGSLVGHGDCTGNVVWEVSGPPPPRRDRAPDPGWGAGRRKACKGQLGNVRG